MKIVTEFFFFKLNQNIKIKADSRHGTEKKYITMKLSNRNVSRFYLSELWLIIKLVMNRSRTAGFIRRKDISKG